MNAAELTAAMLAAKENIDAALAAYLEQVQVDADADRAMKLAMATAYTTAKVQLDGKPTVQAIAAAVDQGTADVQYRARLEAGKLRAAWLLFDSRLKWLSALQSLAAAQREEARLAAYEPREVT